jgi:hypothetical protein
MRACRMPNRLTICLLLHTWHHTNGVGGVTTRTVFRLEVSTLLPQSGLSYISTQKVRQTGLQKRAPLTLLHPTSIMVVRRGAWLFMSARTARNHQCVAQVE